jgi:cephalosporin hydroxylase
MSHGCVDVAVNTNCSEFEVNNWKVSEFIVDRLIPVVGVHPFPLNELFLMVAALCRLKPTHLFEWGTHIGKSARTFYETSKHFGLGAEIHSIDLPNDVDHQEHPRERRAELVRELHDIYLYEGDGLATSLDLVKMLEPPRPLFFIDGDHEYDTVKRELAGILQNVSHANILLHDTFYQSSESTYNIGPHQAIGDVLHTVDNRFRVINTNLGLPGMTLLYQLNGS